MHSALTPGSRIGTYEVLGLLGEGGMGVVYRARDTRLNRDIALKVLPESFAADPDRLARFQREAELLASLNHPNIAAIYGLEHSDGVRALVLELVNGPTLADRIAKGPIPIDEALPIARQIAEVLEAAHRQGVIHRDLKPANVKVRGDGTVKVLDFGLAKLVETTVASSSVGLSQSPTITTPAMTMAGVILGTAAYMSPEQAKGREADKRSDIWAFGCVLFEMLTGKRAFEGEDVSDTLATVLKGEPAWSALPADVPVPVRELIRRCLLKDPGRRPGDIAAALYVLDAISSSGSAVTTSSPVATRSVARRIALVLLTAAATLMAAGLAWWTWRPAPIAPAVARFTFALPEGQQFSFGAQTAVMAISPDGSQIVYAVNQGLFIRSLSDLEPRLIPGSEGAQISPTFSPDGKSIAFVSTLSRPSEGTGQTLVLKRIAVTGGAAVTICGTCSPRGVFRWADDGILFSDAGKGVMRLSNAGGVPELLVPLKDGELAGDPQMLPDRETILYTIATSPSTDFAGKATVVVESLKSHQRKVVLEDAGSSARYVASGHLVYATGGVLFAVPFDWRRQTTYGEGVRLIEGVRRANPVVSGTVHFDVSNNGTAVFLPGPATTALSPQFGLALGEQNGSLDLLKLPPGSYSAPRVAPDGKRVAFHSDTDKGSAISVYELSGTSAPLQITFGGRNRFPVWSPDSRRIAFQSDRDGAPGIFWQSADGAGTPQRLTRAEQGTEQVPESWSGDVLLFSVRKGSKLTAWTASVSNKKPAAPYGGVESVLPINATFSPDGHWVAYTTAESIQSSSAVFVQPFPATGQKFQISRDDDGHHPLWSPRGDELTYIPGPGRFAAVRVRTQPAFMPEFPTSIPRPSFLLQGRTNERNHDILPDGRFIGVVVASGSGQAATSTRSEVHVVLNWIEELKQRVPVR